MNRNIVKNPRAQGLAAIGLLVLALCVKHFTGIDILPAPDGAGSPTPAETAAAEEAARNIPEDTPVRTETPAPAKTPAPARETASAKKTPAPAAASAALPAAARAATRVNFAHFHDGDWVTGVGTVARTLPDDMDPPRHQRFILSDGSGHTVLVAHNIDQAARLDGLAAGDEVAFRGEYRENAQGGVIHWTHGDSSGRRAGGWLHVRARADRGKAAR